MFQYLGIDAFTAMALGVFAMGVGVLMVPIHLILQMRHDEEGFGWREPVYASAAFALGFGIIVVLGSAWDGTGFDLSSGVAVTATLFPTTLAGGLLGRAIGWLLMRIVGAY